jgi:hypothetical protein
MVISVDGGDYPDRVILRVKEAMPDLVLGLEILRQLFFHNRALSRHWLLLCGGRRQYQHGGGAYRHGNQ